MKIHHFGLQVKDIDKTIKFYTEKLGFIIKIPKTLSEDGKYLYSYLALADSEVKIEFVQIQKKPLKKKNPLFPDLFPHIALETKDFDKDLKLLSEKEVKIFERPIVIPNDVKMMTILDPDNYRIDIGQLL